MIEFDRLKQYEQHERKPGEMAQFDAIEKNKKKKVSMAVKRMFAFEDEEWDAVLEPDLMTPELFKKCMMVSARIDDFETFMKLGAAHPDYCEALFAEIEEELKG